jgi:hypothetical protein
MPGDANGMLGVAAGAEAEMHGLQTRGGQIMETEGHDGPREQGKTSGTTGRSKSFGERRR